MRRRRVAWILASTSLATLSSSASAADCVGVNFSDSPFSFFVGANTTCNVAKNYLSFVSGVPALRASGTSAILTWPDGASAVGTFDATNTPAVTADTGGDVQITGGSIDTHATGSAAALAEVDGKVELTGTSIVTELANSPGLAVNGGKLTATDVIVKTDGDASSAPATATALAFRSAAY